MNAFFRMCFAVVAMLASIAACAGEPTPLSAPNIDIRTNGNVQAFALAADGSVYVGGKFTKTANGAHQSLVKLNADGTTNLTWQVDVEGTVAAIAVDTDGSVLVGGNFRSVNGLARNALAKISAAGVVDATWNPSPFGVVTSLQLDGSGMLYVGGSFFRSDTSTDIGNLARFSATGTGAIDASWDAGVDSEVASIALDSTNSRIFIAGFFNHAGGIAQTRLAAISTLSGLAVSGWSFSVNSTVDCVALDSAGTLYVGGGFTAINTQAFSHLARISSAGVLDTTWKPAAQTVLAFALHTGVIYVGSYFLPTVQALQRFSLATAGALDAAFAPVVDDQVHAIVVANSRIYVGGQFRHINGQLRYALGIFSGTDGSLSAAANIYLPGEVHAILNLVDGSTIIGGQFQLVTRTTTRTNLLKLTSAGLLDTTWAADVDGMVLVLNANPAQTMIYLGGIYATVGGNARSYLARVSATTGALDAWSPNPNALVSSLSFDPGGNLFVGGNFVSIASQPIHYLAKFDTSAALLTAFNPNPAGPLRCVINDSSGNLYVGGSFHTIGGGTQSNLARLHPDGTLDTTWQPAIGYVGTGLALDSSGFIYVASGLQKFSTITALQQPAFSAPSGSAYVVAIDSQDRVFAGGQFALQSPKADYNIQFNLFKVDAATLHADLAWLPVPDDVVYALSISPTGQIWVGGAFGFIGSAAHEGVAAIEPPPADRIFAQSADYPLNLE